MAERVATVKCRIVPELPESMTLRDWFAGRAISIIAGIKNATGQYPPEKLAYEAYRLADCMMYERDCEYPERAGREQ